MKNSPTLFAIVGFLFCQASFANEPAIQQQSGKWTTSDQQRYSSATKRRLSGNVLSTEEIKNDEGDPGVHVKLATPKGDLRVYIGPRWFLPHDAMRLTQGQPVTIVGVEISLDGKPQLLASEIQSKDEKLVLREETGKPKWLSTTKEEKDEDYRALRILTKNCAGCHNTSEHPGAKILKELELTDTETLKLMHKFVSEGIMPKEHTDFKNTKDGKFIIRWLGKKSH